METLKPWCSADRDGGFRVLVLSGSEKEDIEVLTTLGTHYDVIIPEGIVLSAILAVEQGSLQNSILAEDGKSLLGPVQEFLKTGRGKCCLPLEAIVARKTGNRFVDDQPIHFDRGDLVPSDMMVVSSRFPPGAESAMRKAAETGGRLLVAGMPDLRYALESASHRVAYWLDKIGKRALVLGGGAAASLMAERATISGGGGAAIQYLATGTTSVYEGLKRNMADFPV